MSEESFRIPGLKVDGEILDIPKWSTSNRPEPEPGQTLVGVNTDLNRLDVWTGSIWVGAGGIGDIFSGVKNKDFSAGTNATYPVNTEDNVVNVVLPSGAETGDVITFIDYKGTFSKNDLGLTATVPIARNKKGQRKSYFNDETVVTLVFVNTVVGWMEIVHDYRTGLEERRVVTFTTSGPHEVAVGHTYIANADDIGEPMTLRLPNTLRDDVGFVRVLATDSVYVDTPIVLNAGSNTIDGEGSTYTIPVGSSTVVVHGHKDPDTGEVFWQTIPSTNIINAVTDNLNTKINTFKQSTLETLSKHREDHESLKQAFNQRTQKVDDYHELHTHQVVKPEGMLEIYRTNILTEIKDYYLPDMAENEVLYFSALPTLTLTEDQPITIVAPSGISIFFEGTQATEFGIREKGKGSLWTACYVENVGYIIY